MIPFYKNKLKFIASSEGVFIILILTLSIYCLVLPRANKDLAILSNESQGLLQTLILSPTLLKNTIEAYGIPGRALYQFIILTVGLTAVISLFILAVLTGHWLKIKKTFWATISPWLFPLSYSLIALIEITIFYLLLDMPLWASPGIYRLTICISLLKRISIILLFGSILIPLFKYFILLRKRYHSK